MRAICDHCGKRRLVHRCRCIACYPGSRIRLCAECELKELRKQCAEEAMKPAYEVKITSSSTTNTTDLEVPK